MCSGGVCRRRPFSPPPDAASCRHHRRGPRWPYVAHGARSAIPRASAPISAIRRSGSAGLLEWASNPACCERARLSSSTCPPVSRLPARARGTAARNHPHRPARCQSSTCGQCAASACFEAVRWLRVLETGRIVRLGERAKSTPTCASLPRPTGTRRLPLTRERRGRISISGSAPTPSPCRRFENSPWQARELTVKQSLPVRAVQGEHNVGKQYRPAGRPNARERITVESADPGATVVTIEVPRS